MTGTGSTTLKLHIAETGQRLIAYCAAPGSATEAAFGRLTDHAVAGA